MKTANRYFVINWHRGKGGHWKPAAREFPTHEHATGVACTMALSLLQDAGEIPDSERFEVFVGSKTKLDSYTCTSRARACAREEAI